LLGSAAFRRLLSLLFAVLLPLTAQADSTDDLVRQTMQAEHIPGVAVLIIRDGQTLKRTAYGEASLELHAPLSVDDRFEIGSVTKAFTATLVMQLVEEGKLSLADPVGKYLAQAPPAWQAVTVERLLSHQSGLADYAFVPGLELLEKWTMADWWAKMPTLPLDFAPGTDAAYSNTNYVLLGLIVEQITGQPCRQRVDERIVQTLGMTHTRWNDDQAVIDHRAAGYLTRKAGLINRPPITETGYDAGLLSTVDDLARFDEGLRAGKLLRPETLARMRTVELLPGSHRSPFGQCWWLTSLRGHWLVSHGGQTAGYAANLSWYPDERLSIVVLANLSDANADLLSRRIAGLYAPEVAIQTLPEAPDSEPALTTQLLTALHALAAGDVAGCPLLDPNYAAKLGTARGKRILTSLAAFKDAPALAFLEAEPSESDRILRYRTHADGKSFVVAFVLTGQAKLYAVASREEVP
jgi:CubicO group peptidase (beta-lactamase class C family)